MKESITDCRREEHGPQQASQLFLLRVWVPGKNVCHGSEDLAGKLQDPVSGHIQYFRGGLELVRILLRTIYREEISSPAEKTDSGQA